MVQPKNRTEYDQKQRITKAALVGALACFVVLALGVGGHVLNLASLSEAKLVQQTAQVVPEEDDSGKLGSKRIIVPPLVSFIGMSFDDVVASLGSGAEVTMTETIKDPDTAVRTVADVALTSSIASASVGTPTVHLSMDANGAVIQAGFTTNLRYLGYGTLSFIDAAENFHVIEAALSEAGLFVPEGTVVVPEAKAEYAIYGADGITLAKEDCVFGGVAASGHEWAGELVFDYTMANAESNLAYTMRLITVTVIAQR